MLKGPTVTDPLVLAKMVYERPDRYPPESDMAVLASGILKLAQKADQKDTAAAVVIEAAIAFVDGECSFEALRLAVKKFLEPV
jgi:hypothetical protein